MVRNFFTLVLLVAAWFGAEFPAHGAAAVDPDVVAATAEPAEVRVDGTTLVYRGNLSAASSRAWERATASVAPGQLNRIVIASGGGDTVEGRRLGRWVRQMNLLVEVDTICFSSCADYVFPAGRARAIRSGAIVGWHGNERSLEVQAARAGLDLRAYFVRRFGAEIAQASPEQRQGLSAEAIIDRRLATLRQSRADEQAFFASLGLDDGFMVCGVGDVLERRADFHQQQGWGFPLSEMARLGLTDTVYLGSDTYHETSRFRSLLLPLTAHSCLDLLPRQ